MVPTLHLHLYTHHNNWTPDTLQSVVHPPACQVQQNLLDGLGMIFGVDTFSGSEQSGFLKPLWVYVHANDPAGLSSLAAHDGRQSDSSEAKHGTRGICLDLDAHNVGVSQPKAV